VTRELGFDSWRGAEIFLIATVPGLALMPIQPHVQFVAGVLSLSREAGVWCYLLISI